jgi:tRNA U55 pseudouridine synthase TruB
LGQYLGCGGYLRELRRLKSEGFSVNDAFTVEQIKQRVSEDKTFLIPMSEAVRLPTAVVNGTGKEDIRNGRPVLMTNMIDDVRAEEDSLVAVLDENRNLLCIARVHRSGGVFGYIERGFY